MAVVVVGCVLSGRRAGEGVDEVGSRLCGGVGGWGVLVGGWGVFVCGGGCGWVVGQWASGVG